MPRGSRSDAEARFAKTQARQREAAKAMSDAEAEAKRVDDNTQRLKALRMARDAKLAEAASVAAEEKAVAAEAKAAVKADKLAAKAAKAKKKAAAAPKAKAKTA